MDTSILCVIDFSDSTRKTLRWAAHKAFKLNAHLTILYPYRLLNPQNGDSIKSARKKIEDEAVRNFDDLEKDMLLNQGITYDFKSEVGFAADRVEEYAKNNDVNFLVIGKNMLTGNRESFDDLVKQMEIPLVIVP